MRLSVARVAAVTMSIAMMTCTVTGCGITTEGTNEALESLSSTLDTVEATLSAAKEKAAVSIEVLRNNGVDVDALISVVDDVKAKANDQIDELGVRSYFDAVDTEMSSIKECYEKIKNAPESTKSYAETNTAALITAMRGNNVSMDFSYLTISDNSPDMLYIFNYASNKSNNTVYANTTEIDFNNIDVSNLVSPYYLLRDTSGAVMYNKLTGTKTAVSADSSDEINAAMKQDNKAILNAEGLMAVMGSESDYVSSVLNAAVESDTFSMDTFVNPNSGIYYTFVYNEDGLKYVITEQESQWGVFIISNVAYGDAADISNTTLLG
jgi:hypothetical protein